MHVDWSVYKVLYFFSIHAIGWASVALLLVRMLKQTERCLDCATQSYSGKLLTNENTICRDLPCWLGIQTQSYFP